MGLICQIKEVKGFQKGVKKSNTLKKPFSPILPKKYVKVLGKKPLIFFDLLVFFLTKTIYHTCLAPFDSATEQR